MEYDLPMRLSKQDKRNRDRSSSQSDSSKKQPKKKAREQSDSELSSISDSELQKLEKTVNLKESAESLDKSDRSSDSDSDYYPTEKEKKKSATKKEVEVEKEDRDKLEKHGWKSSGNVPRDLKFYKEIPNESIIEPKDFENDRNKQALRWISTALHTRLNDLDRGQSGKNEPVEVQSYLDDKDKKVLVAPNNKGARQNLEKHYKELTGIQALDQIDKQIVELNKKEARTQRHLEKLKRRIVNPNDHYKKTYKDILEPLTNSPFTIVDDGDKINNRLHGERRINKRLKKEGKKLNPKNLGGIRRPCLACKADLYDEEDLQNSKKHAGAYYYNKTARQDVSPSKLDRLIAEDHTCWTQPQTKDAPVTDAFDTDSDTDVEGNPISQRKKKQTQ